MFSFAWPPAAFFALINNLIEIRLDCHKLCISCKRPKFLSVEGIGTWLYLLQIVSFLGILTTFGYLYVEYHDHQINLLTYTNNLIDNLPMWIIIVILEHIVIIIKVQ